MSTRASHERLMLAGIVVIGAAIRFWGLGAESFWHDESWTWGIVQGQPGHVLERLRQYDEHPPLFFLLLRTWSFFGAHMSEGWLRTISAVFGVVSIPLMHGLGRRLGGVRVGLTAALLLAMSPYALHYSQEARSYAFLFSLCLISLTLIVALVESSSLAKRVGFGVVTAAIMLTHYMGIFFVASEMVALLILARERRGLLKDAAIAAGVAAVAYLPWLPTFIEHARGVDREFWILKPTYDIVDRSLRDLVGSEIPALQRYTSPAAIVWSLTLIAPFIIRRRIGWALLAMVVIPPVGQILVSLERPLFYTQTFQYILIPMFVLIAMLFAKLPARAGAIAALAAVGLLVPGVVKEHRELSKEDWRGGEARVAAALQPGERVIVPQGYLAVNFSYYGSLANIPRDWNDSIRPIGSGDMLHPGHTRESVLQELATAPGAWLVTRYTEDAEWTPALSGIFAKVEVWSSRGVMIVHYRRK